MMVRNVALGRDSRNMAKELIMDGVGIRKWLACLFTIALLAGSTIASQSLESTARAATPGTLSIFTCCGSISGFNDATPGDLTSMHALYAGRLATLFPNLRWKETTFSSEKALESSLAATVRAGNPPDMAVIQGGDIGALVLQGLVQRLDAYYQRDHVGGSNFLPGMAHWARFGGHWWALPAVSGPLGGQEIYLPTYMSQLGFDNTSLRSFDDYYNMSRKATRFDNQGNLTRIGYWPGVDSWETTGTLMCPVGRGLYNAADQPTATDPCNLAYLGYLAKLTKLYGGYARLSTFLAGDPDFLSGNPHSYMVLGKAAIVPSGGAYWNIQPFDQHSFGVKGGLSYQLTPLPPTPDGSAANVANYPSTLQEIVIPVGAGRPDYAFAVGKAMFWDNGDLLGGSLSGSPTVINQRQWLNDAVAGERALRQLAGLPGNPIARLAGFKNQPALGLESKASNPISPADAYYQQQLHSATTSVLEGRESPAAALAIVQRKVLSEEQRLRTIYGAWNW
jgi:ABC-type glycerol-3-phosphate transport system substrate-binding protein